jgi:tRNA A37 N6-isopentenylltransferase MiaA
MNYNNMKKSISLIGPSCVGKSLLAEQLGKKYKMPVINMDDLLAYIQYEMNGLISEDEVVQNALGEHVYTQFYNIKRAEWDDYRIQVFDYEREKFLNI